MRKLRGFLFCPWDDFGTTIQIFHRFLHFTDGILARLIVQMTVDFERRFDVLMPEPL